MSLAEHGLVTLLIKKDLASPNLIKLFALRVISVRAMVPVLSGSLLTVIFGDHPTEPCPLLVITLTTFKEHEVV